MVLLCTVYKKTTDLDYNSMHYYLGVTYGKEEIYGLMLGD